MSDAEDEDSGVFEIVDYTQSTAWERFLARVEATLRKWGLYGSQGLDVGELQRPYVSEDVDYEGKLYTLTYHYRSAAASVPPVATAGEGLSQPLLTLLHNTDDFPAHAHRLQRWFGVRDLLTLTAAHHRTTTASETMTLRSALCVALLNVRCSVPAFVCEGNPNKGVFHGYMVHGGVCTHFHTDCQADTPVHYEHMTGLVGLFTSKLNISKADLPRIMASARFTFMAGCSAYGSAWREEGGGMASPAAATATPAQRTPLWGPPNDPVQAIHLATTWAQFADGTLVDNNVYSDLDALSAPAWSLRCIWAPHARSMLSESLSALVECLDDVSPQHTTLASIVGSSYGAVSPISQAAAHTTLTHLTESLVRSLRHGGLPSADEVDSILQELFMHTPYHITTDAERALGSRVCGAPAGSLLSQLAMYMALLGNVRAIALLWVEFVREVRWHWDNKLKLCRLHETEMPDMRCCLLYQKLQMLNYCIGRVTAGAQAGAQADAQEEGEEDSDDDFADAEESAEWFDAPATRAGGEEEEGEEEEHAASGDMADRRGAKARVTDTYLLASGRPMYEPCTQDVGIYTADMVEEQQQVWQSIGDDDEAREVRARMQGVHLKADMSAFKAANPAAVLHDFVRWHSPRDWSITDEGRATHDAQVAAAARGDATLLSGEGPWCGELSARMQGEDNLWRRLWRESRAVPAAQQRPLFNAEAEAEKVLHYLETVPPRELLSQMVVVALTNGFHTLTHTRVKDVEPVRKAAAALVQVMKECCGEAMTRDDGERVCEAMEDVEVVSAQVLSLMNKLDNNQRIVEGVMREPECVLTTPDERGCVMPLFRAVHGDALDKPDVKEFVLRGVTTPHGSRPLPQRMYALLSPDEFRVALALSRADI